MAEKGADEQEQHESGLIPLLKHERRHFSQISMPSNGLILKKLPGGYITVGAVRKRRTLSEQVNRYDRVMQANASSTLAIATSPTLHKDHWQQRRYTFLSKNSMLGGELKDEVVIEHGNDVEQKSIFDTPPMATSFTMDCDRSNIKNDSILSRAVTGVRNLLAEDDEDKQVNGTSLCLKNIVLTQQDSNELAEFDGNDGDNSHHRIISAQCTQTDNDLLQTPRKNILPHTTVKYPPLNKFVSCLSCKDNQSENLVEIQHSYRPYFTYWVTFVQIFVCAISLIVYGYAPFTSTQSNNTSIFNQQRFDLTMNIWFGPHPADLIRLGAKYTPCMRKHDEVNGRYEKQAKLETISGCCIDSIANRCMQTLSQQCLTRAALTWYQIPLKSKNLTEINSVIYPAVCGLTPETCTKKLTGNILREDESSWTSTIVDSKIFKWSPNAVKWPICLEQDYSRISNNISLYPHMQCTNIVRPCCTGVLGDCILTSRDDCRRRRGIFHARAHLCSQVDCIQSVCGMLEFFVARVPDQVYRFWTVIFIHAGLIHLLITIIFQYTIMRPLEKLAGCIRVMIIYIVSGFVGSLASALFLRDSIQVGPGGSQLAILACYLSELFLGWRSLKRPWIPFFKIIVCLFLLLTVGLLPLVDNYSQCFGFLIGFMLNMIVFPDVNFRKNVRRLVVVTTSLAITIAVFITLIVLFYTVPFKCKSCTLFSCPFGKICGNEKHDLI
ncbi:unnamed protein product [Rotaria socialis]|uniref:Peptidase S54 rhomboid domain-containing protein n=2 Tax=Rotaria socialis TaxID=392032 RepID=A0A818G4J3_9BILA|nr:unnamed protein product [Rotaria socialis]CAF3485731.1 unnamed protein product [Rotaria socialis]CAF3642555.1 unnamed protein product [Rotaria socialis]CAF4272780.1 unnamed protein product [Rotaria socialis]CAF4455390.1 unnamed protein product [Rotaria socialis]